MLTEAAAATRQELDALEHVVGDERLEDVQLEVPLARADLNRGVVAHHLGRHHRQALALGGVHLARHDRGARLVLRQDQLPKAAARAAAEPTDVIGDLHQRTRQHRQGAMGGGQRLMAGEGLELVRGAAEAGAQPLTQSRGHSLSKALRGVQSGAHRGAANGQLPHPRQALADRLDRQLQLGDITAELLAQAQGHRILQVRPADLHQVGIGRGLGLERGGQVFDGRE